MTTLDEAAADLCADGLADGEMLFVIHLTDSGDVRYIGPSYPPELVARMLRTAAEAYVEQIPPVKLN